LSCWAVALAGTNKNRTAIPHKDNTPTFSEPGLQMDMSFLQNRDGNRGRLPNRLTAELYQRAAQGAIDRNSIFFNVDCFNRNQTAFDCFHFGQLLVEQFCESGQQNHPQKELGPDSFWSP
jgi:hypothetical protein